MCPDFNIHLRINGSDFCLQTQLQTVFLSAFLESVLACFGIREQAQDLLLPRQSPEPLSYIPSLVFLLISHSHPSQNWYFSFLLNLFLFLVRSLVVPHLGSFACLLSLLSFTSKSCQLCLQNIPGAFLFSISVAVFHLASGNKLWSSLALVIVVPWCLRERSPRTPCEYKNPEMLMWFIQEAQCLYVACDILCGL